MLVYPHPQFEFQVHCSLCCSSGHSCRLLIWKQIQYICGTEPCTLMLALCSHITNTHTYTCMILWHISYISYQHLQLYHYIQYIYIIHKSYTHMYLFIYATCTYICIYTYSIYILHLHTIGISCTWLSNIHLAGARCCNAKGLRMLANSEHIRW